MSAIDLAMAKYKQFLDERVDKRPANSNVVELAPVSTNSAPKPSQAPAKVMRPPATDGKMAASGVDKDDDLVDDGNGNWVMRKYVV